ncbi:isochorismatase family protein [Bradyrhizobium sp.]|uniref:isochorismatase family protein n=1 Tax=Bradyrhizobium sp. TaxID=376 RepID=UPI002CD8FDE9|nr:isochorismatase family protein [Bradyrhizobium sp.]HWX59142.1 isochorismatase family protein [Bradyrhizobium sp.]
MDVIIVVDMQVGMLDDAPKHDLQGVLDRINALTAMVRRGAGKVIWIRHCGKPGDGFEPHTPGWEFLPALIRRPDDIVVEKSLNDPFVGTSLRTTLADLAPGRVLVAGWATDFCVDATVRSCVSGDQHVVVVRDGHTLSDRPHLGAAAVIAHHNWVWDGLISNRSIRLATTHELLSEADALPDGRIHSA